jgi:hypothetical protein
MKLPTSNIEAFKEHLSNPNKPFQIAESEETPGQIMKVQKNIVLSYVSDSTGCGHIRNIFPMTYLNSVFGKSGRFNIVISPAMIFQNDILMKTRSIFFQRTMAPGHIDAVRQYKSLQQKYGFKMLYDIDDFIWKGSDEGECVPAYNFGGYTIGDDVRQASIDIMNMMDLVCVSTDFLGEYIQKRGVKVPVKTVYNAISQYFWGNQRKKPIKEKIIKPKVIYTGSPTHYYNEKRLVGDWENAWLEWVLKNVKDNKIDFFCMGGLPFFFEEIKNKIKIIQWVNSYQYHLPIRNYKPDFGIAPLVPNYFNYSKSDIKHIEYCAVGAVSIGTTFTNGRPSPYDNNFANITDKSSVEDIDKLFWSLTEPEKYNEILNKQYKMLNETGRWLESDKYINMMADIL